MVGFIERYDRLVKLMDRAKSAYDAMVGRVVKALAGNDDRAIAVLRQRAAIVGERYWTLWREFEAEA